MTTGVRIDLSKLPQVMKKIDVRMNAGMAAATLEANNFIVKAVSRTQPTMRTSGGALTGLDPSRPGEYPKVVTRRLMQSIGWKLQGGEFGTSGTIKGRVTTNAKYAKYLEYGGRSFMRRGVKENLLKIGHAFIKGAH